MVRAVQVAEDWALAVLVTVVAEGRVRAMAAAGAASAMALEKKAVEERAAEERAAEQRAVEERAVEERAAIALAQQRRR